MKLKPPDWLVDRIIAYAKRTPYQHIHTKDGRIYMERYWILPYPVGPEHPKYNTPWQRFRRKFLGHAIRVHHICLPDQERDVHSHPWPFVSVILRGWYEEMERRGGGARFCVRMRGDVVRKQAKDMHRICQVSYSGAWTLFMTGPKQQSWGFLVDGEVVPWRKYLNDYTTTGTSD